MKTTSPDAPRDLPAALFAKVFLPFAAGYYLSYLYRTVNAVISAELTRELGLRAIDLGLLTSAYFLAFALFQLPLGILLDRYGPRRVNAGLLLFAAAGGAVFSFAESVAGLTFGRALIGLGVSGALMSSMKAFVLWFPISRLASLNGWLMAVGGLGALTASAPVEAALGIAGWRGVFVALAVTTLAAAALVFAIVPEKERTAASEPIGQLARGLARIYASPVFWRLALVCMTVQAGFMAVQGLWVAPWLRDVAGFDRRQVADALSLLAIAMTIGFATWGTLSDWLARRGVEPIRVFKAAIGVSVASFGALALARPGGAMFLWAMLNLFSTSAALSYSILSREFPAALSGRVNTAVNLLIFVAAFAAQFGIGAIMDLWPVADGRYPAEAYRAAFGIVAALQLVAFLVLLPARVAPTAARPV
ncbi:MAG: MFS transporter [Burkholderiales bacterium]|jgi:MFS family permease|nr:MFS transporter [Burkholderiales bacterium]